ncbi:MAG: VWA domain-containing protein [Erysipelotrichaceae bacterium]|nr:VWA domain-containing protein [Erysipelotrichaceae bacterium]MDD7057635.1 VWA domain-containing protein [Erysipelotrichaceae bacterium]MDY3659654.1 vWA domain-containing protein [Bulleidia sp.]
MKYETSELVFILDRSGSMSGLEKDTIGGFNSLIQKQSKEKGKCYVSCVLFDDVQEVIYDRVPLNEVKKMTQKQYYARGCTALLDAMGGAIHHIGNVHKYSKEEIGKTLFIIITDGLENSSKRYTYVTIKQMVERQKEKYGWEFIFIGANMDVIQEANKFGIDQAVRYACDEEGTALNYSVLSENIIKMRTTVGNAKESLPNDWPHKIREDYHKRK